MKHNIFITGSNGFVGTNLISSFNEKYKIIPYIKNSKISINENIVIHLAGKAHDLKNISGKDDYYQVNTELTKKVFDAFLLSEAKVFIQLSSVKAVADEVHGILNEDAVPSPITHYGKSKLLAEQYLLSKNIPKSKRVYILRPSMIHGPGNKGNLNLLYKIGNSSLPWPLGAFDNKRSFCSVDNLCFIIKELIENDTIPSGIYNISDDESLSTNELISLIAASKSHEAVIWNVSKRFIQFVAKFGDILKLPLNSERLQKLTESYVVNNKKIKEAIGKPLPLSAREGLLKTFNSFNSDAK